MEANVEQVGQPGSAKAPTRWVQLLRCDLPASGVSCESCGMPSWATSRWYRVPGRRGYFCSIRCCECEVFGPRSCRWCGAPLDSNAKRFCDERCGDRSRQVPFGNGARLLRYLAAQQPARFHGPDGDSGCAGCGAPLSEKKSEARYCSDRCRKRVKRAAVREDENRREIADTAPMKSVTYEDGFPGMGRKPMKALSRTNGALKKAVSVPAHLLETGEMPAAAICEGEKP